MTTVVRVEHRGQRVDLTTPNVVNATSMGLLRDVGDWFERGCCDQIKGYEQGESPSATISIDNSGGLAAAALAYPLGATVTILEDDEPVLIAQAVRYSLGPVIELSLEV